DTTGARLAASMLGPAPEDSWLVGDSVVDVATAKSAGMVAVGVTWAVHGPLREALGGADLLFDTPLALLELVSRAA
ncbi:MAG: HAD family hydrolase, partial [Polyangiaceae bacterium]|nr:HAD family hydrolase [Polyangiaceae bacterium]